MPLLRCPDAVLDSHLHQKEKLSEHGSVRSPSPLHSQSGACPQQPSICLDSRTGCCKAIHLTVLPHCPWGGCETRAARAHLAEPGFAGCLCPGADGAQRRRRNSCIASRLEAMATLRWQKRVVTFARRHEDTRRHEEASGLQGFRSSLGFRSSAGFQGFMSSEESHPRLPTHCIAIRGCYRTHRSGGGHCYSLVLGCSIVGCAIATARSRQSVRDVDGGLLCRRRCHQPPPVGAASFRRGWPPGFWLQFGLSSLRVRTSASIN